MKAPPHPESAPSFGMTVVQRPTSNPLRSRPIDFCVEENGNPVEWRNRRAEMHKLPGSQQVGVTFYSHVRSLRGLLIGHGCAGFPRVTFSSRLLKKGCTCFDKLSMSANFSKIFQLSPLVLSLSKDSSGVFQQPVRPPPFSKEVSKSTARQNRNQRTTRGFTAEAQEYAEGREGFVECRGKRGFFPISAPSAPLW